MVKSISMAVLAVLLVLAGGVLANMFPKYAALLGAKSAVVGGVNGTQVNVPVSFQSPAVTNVQLNYNFIGPIKSITSNKTPNSGSTLLLNSSDNHLPGFTVTDRTQVMKLDSKGAQTPAAPADLKVGTAVGVVAYFDIRTASWTTTHVFISPAGGFGPNSSPKPSSSPTATPKK